MPPVRPICTPDLAATIAKVQSDVRELIEDAAAREAAAAGGSVPAVVIARQIWARANFCACRAFDEIKDAD
jgi:hypothetical protein